MKKTLFFLSVSMFFLASNTFASPVSWTDWNAETAGAPGVTGILTIDSNTIDVTFSGLYSLAQINGGTNYWDPSTPYISATVDNAPPASDIIELSAGGTATITFSEAVTDPVIALVSWNGNTVDFGDDRIQFLSYGQGYWGNGTPQISPDGTGFYGNGEVHGVIQLTGDYTSITFTHTSEGWHGFTVGALGLGGETPAAPVPEPATMLLIGSGLIGLAAFRRKIVRK
jgi:hypothetical protein